MSARRGTRGLLLNAGLALGGLLTLAPLFWMVSASLMPAGDASTLPPHLLPRKVTFEHYVALFTRLDLARYFLNSAFITIMATLLSVIVSSLCGYALAKLRFKGRDGILKGFAAALVVPAQVGMLPLFLLLREMGFVNTYVGVLVPYLASIFAILMIRQYMLSFPDDLIAAARIDGAGELRIFWSIVVPIVKPILVTLGAFTFLSAWNDFMWPLIILSDDSRYTLPVALANLVGEHVQDIELMMAGSVITILPALAVFLVFQRAYVRGLTAGGIKG
jgi:multiple sugar transport system permease protein